MHTKFVTNSNSGNKNISAKKGLSDNAVGYMGKDEKKGEAKFFSDTKDKMFNKNEVMNFINNNIKGLQAKDDKYELIVISPSQQELMHIGEDPKKLEEFTRDVMMNYQKNFKIPNKDPENNPKPLWFAIEHNARYFTSKDEKISSRVFELKNQNKTLDQVLDLRKNDEFFMNNKISEADIKTFYKIGIVKNGELKQGDQRHIHIVVSRRDAEMRVNLNPNVSTRFEKNNFFRKNMETFNLKFQFNNKSNNLNNYDEKRINQKINFLSTNYKLPDGYLKADTIIDAYRAASDKELFKKRFYSLEYQIKKGIFTHEPISYLKNDNASSIKKKYQSNFRHKPANSINLIPYNPLSKLASSLGQGIQSNIIKRKRRKKRLRRDNDDREQQR